MALNSAAIKSIRDIMRKDAGVDGDARRTLVIQVPDAFRWQPSIFL
jgi:hypothetical protein